MKKLESFDKKTCNVKKGPLKCERNTKQTTILLVIGIMLIAIAWFSEIFFHYVQEFNMNSIDPEIFWKFEPVEALNSTSLMISGIVMVLIALYIKYKNWKK